MHETHVDMSFLPQGHIRFQPHCIEYGAGVCNKNVPGRSAQMNSEWQFPLKGTLQESTFLFTITSFPKRHTGVSLKSMQMRDNSSILLRSVFALLS